MCQGKCKAFSLMELMIVVVVIAIISTFAIPGYHGVRQRALNDEARSMLSLIRAAERMRELETGAFVGCTDSATCSQALDLELPTASPWVYSVNATANDFEATAIDTATVPNVWCINRTMSEAVADGC